MNQMIKRNVVIGHNIRKMRMDGDLTQEELTVKLQLHGCDISRSTLAKIESGLRNISVEEIETVKMIFNASYEDFFKK